MFKFSKRQFLMETGLDEKDIKVYTAPAQTFEGFGIEFDSFTDAAQFFTNLGVNCGHNEHSTSLNPHLIMADDARILADMSLMESTEGTGFEVYFPGCELYDE